MKIPFTSMRMTRTSVVPPSPQRDNIPPSMCDPLDVKRNCSDDSSVFSGLAEASHQELGEEYYQDDVGVGEDSGVTTQSSGTGSYTDDILLHRREYDSSTQVTYSIAQSGALQSSLGGPYNNSGSHPDSTYSSSKMGGSSTEESDAYSSFLPHDVPTESTMTDHSHRSRLREMPPMVDSDTAFGMSSTISSSQPTSSGGIFEEPSDSRDPPNPWLATGHASNTNKIIQNPELFNDSDTNTQMTWGSANDVPRPKGTVKLVSQVSFLGDSKPENQSARVKTSSKLPHLEEECRNPIEECPTDDSGSRIVEMVNDFEKQMDASLRSIRDDDQDPYEVLSELQDMTPRRVKSEDDTTKAVLTPHKARKLQRILHEARTEVEVLRDNNEQYKSEIEQMEEEHKSELKLLEDRTKQKLAELRFMYQEEIDKLVLEKDAAVIEAGRQAARYAESGKKQVSMMKKKLERLTSTATATIKEKVEEANRNALAMKDKEFAARLGALRTSYESELEKLRKECDNRVKSEVEKAVSSVAQQVRLNQDILVSELREQIESLRKEKWTIQTVLKAVKGNFVKHYPDEMKTYAKKSEDFAGTARKFLDKDASPNEGVEGDLKEVIETFAFLLECMEKKVAPVQYMTEVEETKHERNEVYSQVRKELLLRHRAEIDHVRKERDEAKEKLKTVEANFKKLGREKKFLEEKHRRALENHRQRIEKLQAEKDTALEIEKSRKDLAAAMAAGRREMSKSVNHNTKEPSDGKKGQGGICTSISEPGDDSPIPAPPKRHTILVDHQKYVFESASVRKARTFLNQHSPRDSPRLSPSHSYHHRRSFGTTETKRAFSDDSPIKSYDLIMPEKKNRSATGTDHLTSDINSFCNDENRSSNENVSTETRTLNVLDPDEERPKSLLETTAVSHARDGIHPVPDIKKHLIVPEKKYRSATGTDHQTSDSNNACNDENLTSNENVNTETRTLNVLGPDEERTLQPKSLLEPTATSHARNGIHPVPEIKKHLIVPEKENRSATGTDHQTSDSNSFCNDENRSSNENVSTETRTLNVLDPDEERPKSLLETTAVSHARDGIHPVPDIKKHLIVPEKKYRSATGTDHQTSDSNNACNDENLTSNENVNTETRTLNVLGPDEERTLQPKSLLEPTATSHARNGIHPVPEIKKHLIVPEKENRSATGTDHQTSDSNSFCNDENRSSNENVSTETRTLNVLDPDEERPLQPKSLLEPTAVSHARDGIHPVPNMKKSKSDGSNSFVKSKDTILSNLRNQAKNANEHKDDSIMSRIEPIGKVVDVEPSARRKSFAILRTFKNKKETQKKDPSSDSPFHSSDNPDGKEDPSNVMSRSIRRARLPPELVPLLSAVPAEDVPIAAQSTAPVSVGTSLETCSFASTNNKDLPVHSLEPEWTKRFTKSRGTDNPNDHFLPTPTSGNQFLPPRTSDNLTTDNHTYKKTPPSTQKRSGRGSHVPSKTGTLDHRSTFDNTLSPATAPICGEDEHETQMRSFNEKFNRLLFNIDLSGNGLNGEEPKKPRGSQQLTNGDYEEHLEVCLAIASKNKQALAPLRERLQAKFYDIASSYTVRTGKTPTGVEVLQLLRGGKLMVRQRDVFRAIHECHAVRAKHAKQNASMEVVKERYGNITRQMVNTFIDMCPTCLRRPPVIKPLKGAARPIYSNNFRDRFQIDLIDMQDKPKRDDRGVICRWILVLKDHFTKLTYCEPIPRKRPKHVVQVLSRIFGFIGSPKVFHTDNGKEFTAKIILQMLRELNPDILAVCGRARKPSDQGSVESRNKMVKLLLQDIEDEEKKRKKKTNWTMLMGPLMAGINGHKVRGKNATSANENVFGMPLHEPLECDPALLRQCFTVRERLNLLPDPEFEASLQEYYIIDGEFESDGFVYPILPCEVCTFHSKQVQLCVGNKAYEKKILSPEPWWDTAFIASFAAILAHDTHNPGLLYIHCQFPKSVISKKEVHVIDEERTVLSVLHGAMHYVVLELDILERTVWICDGRKYPLLTWANHITNILKRTALLDLNVEPDYGTKSDPCSQSFLKVNGEQEWTIKSDTLVLQPDVVNCGPIACMKLWTMFQPGEVDVREEGLAIDRSAPSSGENFVDMTTNDVTNDVTSQRNSSYEERCQKRTLAKQKQKNAQIIQAKKMMALRNKSTPTLERGMVVSVKPDPRDVKRARGVLAIVCDVSGSGAGGIKVATGYGPITQGNNQETFYVPADRYTIPKIQDLALDAELEKVRRQVMEGTFEEGSCKGLTVQAAHKLGFGDSPRRPKGCRCKMGKCTNFCGCVKAGRKCNSAMEIAVSRQKFFLKERISVLT
ncbi:integrase core domain containing protein [Nitzschia inconspicua]|uniref:Integrase core domain containing protein n=1 Tax=Nitzschia inconspicua TaxID=303405 RepID=A0A9K3KEK9_9STRA|nr:integrase core domain containing protein [Nitzschia inconspicua]